ncbi:surface lipoprotein assembly modifier [Thalassococcus arenae]|uniref:surface lipoprotein assembly modifier n=1 Tax=Thalassococcus arenae TaxID=2851652 RepID=UPI0032AFB7DF
MLACVTALSLGGGALAQSADATGTTLRLTPAQARQAAMTAVQTGRIDAAITLAEALVAAEPEASLGHFILAHAYLRAGQPDKAAAPARRAYQHATSPVEKQESARVAAMAAAARERYLASQIWLRLAIQAAPTPELKARSVREFQAARNRAKLRLSFGLSVMPSSNVNGGSSADVIEVDGESRTIFGTIPLPATSEALSGTEMRGRLRFSHALDRAERSRTDLVGALDVKRVRFSDAARDRVPGLDAADYGSSNAELGVIHRRVLGEGRLAPVLSGGLHLGRSWYGGLVDYDYARLEAGLAVALTESLTLSTNLGRQIERDADAPLEHVTTSAQLALSHRFDNNDRVSLGFYGAETQGDDGQRRKRVDAVQLRYVRDKPVGPVQVALGLSAMRVTYPDFRVLLFGTPDGGRRDEILSADLGLTLHDLDYWGFVPTVNIRARRTESNVSFYESEGVSISLGFESAF